MRNISARLSVRPAIVVVNVLTALVVQACSTACVDARSSSSISPSSSSNASCKRRPLPWGELGRPLVGANVIDIDDVSDDDPSNDGARGYGSDAARRTLDALRDDGLTGVVLPVPLRASGKNATTVRPGSLLADTHGRARLATMIDDAKARGLMVIVVPHLALDDGTWRGDLAPQHNGVDDAQASALFLASYADALTPLIDLAEAHCADALSVAVEFKSLSTDPTVDDAFRDLIGRVRASFTGIVTYSANWDEVEESRHWRALDVVGVNAFAPLAPRASATDDDLVKGAAAFQDALDAVGAHVEKPVWMIEVGFKSSPSSFVEPWKWPAEIAEANPVRDDDAQARAYRAVFTAARVNARLDALFLWAVPSDLDDAKRAFPHEPDFGFSYVDKKAHDVVRAMVRPRR